MSASTSWREQVSADEAQVFEQFRGIMRTIQLKNSAQSGPGRGLHRKAPLSVQARFEVLDRLPAHARQGLFARPAAYDAWVRLSNAAPAVQPDRATDVRGFAIKVWGVQGAGALGNSTECQDFLLFNLPAFPFPTPDEFVGLMQAQVAGGGALFKYLLKRYGLFRALGYLRRLSRKRPFAGFAGAPFFSGAPFACGPYAAKMRMLPARPATQPGNPDDLGADFLAALKAGPLSFDIQLQFFVSEDQTPIENAAVDWPDTVAPYVTVARLSVAPSAISSRSDPAFAQQVEADSFDPWKALAEHRPLGRVMRARKVIYFDSAQNRNGASHGSDLVPPPAMGSVKRG